jgi:hypothetical protein
MTGSDRWPAEGGWEYSYSFDLGSGQSTWKDRPAVLATLGEFEPISLAELNRVPLLDRVEVKYMLPLQSIDCVLRALQLAYRVLAIEEQQINHYRTLYFDTPDLAMYRRHHMGARNRYKVRSRQYVESRYTFLEVKHKTNKQHTIKSRLSTDSLVTSMNQASLDFLRDKCPYDGLELVPYLWNTYARITLASKSRAERVTIDMKLAFAWQERKAFLPNIVIAEVKRDGSAEGSDFITLMRRMGIRKTGFSKYCVGITLLYPEVKQNRFRKLHRLIARVSQGGSYAAA